MYFKKLEIFGFKSFADKTVLNFEPGITAVVGPNGCGKSNIFDSIRWVLGEQSVKEMRGSSMEDVIFNGTDKKAGLGFAEVNLTFSNESRMLPVEYNEVTVTRRLFRSGESEYLLNKTVVRLKDIQELFMGTGIGAEAYSLVQQGKVDLVVSARPEDRRIILDEASGITKYKSKKKEALNKLKDTENNLLRINDIIIEVKRQIASIERQANKARRFKEEFEKLKVLEVHLARQQIEFFAGEKAQAANLLEEFKVREEKVRAEVEELNNLIVYEEGLLGDLEQKISEINAEEIKIENQIEMEQRQIGFNEERIEQLRSNEERLLQQKNQLAERCRGQEAKIAELKAVLSVLVETLQKNTALLAEKKETLGVILQAVHHNKETIRQDEEKILGTTTRQVKIKNELTEVMKESQGALARKRRLEHENAKVSAEKSEIELKFQHVCAQMDKALSRANDLKAQREAKQAALNGLKDRLSALHQSISELEKKKFLLTSQKEFIEKLRVQYQDIPDPVVEGRLITQVAPLEKHNGIIGKVKEARQINQPAEVPLYEITCETKFIELDPQDIMVKISEASLEVEAELAHKEETLTQIGEQQAELDRLEEETHTEEKTLSIFESQKNDILVDTNKLMGELELVDIELKEVIDLLANLKHKEDALNETLNASNKEIQDLQINIRHCRQDIEQKTREREATTVAIAQLETEIGSFEDNEKQQQASVRLVAETLQTGLDEIKRIEEESAESAGKKVKIAQEIEILTQKIEELKAKKQSLKDVLDKYEQQRAEMNQRLNSVRLQVSGLEKDTQEIKNETHVQALKTQEIVYKEQSIKDKLLQTYKINLDEDALEPAADPAAAPVVEIGLAGEALISEIDRLKKRCDSFGSVNLVAIDEFEELRRRFEFLTKQQSDLLTAKDALHQTISKINRTTRQMFMETFTKVSEEFRIYFRMLFGGGEAQLILLDQENVLESGIEIIARPPGKKLQNISLLSGGEKTLTAIALIFGVFKVRPSPFCVLDEIDAALDESNVGRFGYLLKDFAKIAQFIVITHNKKTIAYANVMYGITMQETGVSKIVSVKFAEDEEKVPEPQEAAAGV